MAHSLFILNKNFIETTDLIENLQNIASKLGLNFDKVKDRQVDLYKSDFGDLVEIHFLDAHKFNALKNDEDGTFIKDYSCLFYFSIYPENQEEDRISIPILKAFLNRYPDLLVFNEEYLPEGVDYYVYTKVDIDAFDKDEYLASFTKPPKN